MIEKKSLNASLYTLPNDQPILQLECDEAFNRLSKEQKLYAYYYSQASWNGIFVVYFQTSPEAPLIFALLHKILIAEPIADLKKKALANGLTEDEFTAFLVYICGVLSNAGNYKSFGDTKIVPNLPKETFESLVKASKAYKDDESGVKFLWNKVQEPLYSLFAKVRSLGMDDKGITSYFSSNCSQEDADLANEFMQFKGLELHNSRCFKTDRPDSKREYEIRLASAETKDDPKVTSPREEFKGAEFKVTRGDYHLFLRRVVENLRKAKEFAANDVESGILDNFVDHLVTGSQEYHRIASKSWAKYKAPAVDAYLGFISRYRDPTGQRAEFRGQIGIANEETSKKFAKLVSDAENLLPMLPWGRDFENDEYAKPDFVSLDVLTYASSTVPLGLCLPTYDDVEERKTLSLRNVILARMEKGESIPFVSKDDEALMNERRIACWEVQVGLHELLGHASGKLLKQREDGTFNFDPAKVKNPLTGEAVTKWYEPGKPLFKGVFAGPLGSAYEECRSEAVGLYLSLEAKVMGHFGYEGSDATDVTYANWLQMMWMGCKALEMYRPETKTWLQAHSQARYVLLRVCLEAGEDLVRVEETEAGKDLRITLNRDKMRTVGKKAVGDFLLKLQFYKSTADVDAARRMFDGYSEVPDGGAHPWAKWRDIVVAQKKPPKIFVQCNTLIDGSGDVVLKKYDASLEGYIQSWIDRFPSADVSDNVIELWNRDQEHFF